MLYYLIEYLEQIYQPPGFQIIRFITVRAALAAITALVIALFAGRSIINWLSRKQVGEQVREGEHAGVIDHAHKRGTPTMGGIIILLAVLGATLLWGAVGEVYVWLIMLSTAWMGAFGFADDYIKVVRRDKSGLPARIKLFGQISLGLIVGSVLYFHPQFADINTALSNAVNLTDGLDGLAAGVTAIVAMGLTALCYIAGNAVFAGFLNEMLIPGAGELTIFAAALAAACLGFLWFNGYTATVFMGDTGSLALGAAVGALALMIKKELLLPVLCAVFFMESLSVIIQTTYFKYTRRKYGVGKRVFRMAPLHHHFEAKGTPEPKIVLRFWIVTVVTVIATLLVLRIR